MNFKLSYAAAYFELNEFEKEKIKNKPTSFHWYFLVFCRKKFHIIQFSTFLQGGCCTFLM